MIFLRIEVLEKKSSLTLRKWCAVSQTQGIYQSAGSLSTRLSILGVPEVHSSVDLIHIHGLGFVQAS